MAVNISNIYDAKISEIKNKVNSRLQTINTTTGNNFKLYFENSSTRLTVKNTANMTKTTYDEIIKDKAKKYSVDENLIKAVIKAESGFDSNAVSGSGAVGLMQLMPATAAGLGVLNSFDPEQNIDGGVKYLKGQIDRFDGNVKMALAAYNCGPNRVKSLNITNPEDEKQFLRLPKETQNYINKIYGFMNL